MEKGIIERMQAGNHRDDRDPMLVRPQLPISIEERHPELDTSHLHTVDGIFLMPQRLVGFEGHGRLEQCWRR
jgi:hypothetical protein